MPPVEVKDTAKAHVIVVSNEGRMLVFPIADLPQLAKGKGNKMISIPALRAQSREEYVVATSVASPDSTVTLHAGRRKLTLKPADLAHYQGERGRRGNKLPRGLQRVDRIEVEATANEPESSDPVNDSDE